MLKFIISALALAVFAATYEIASVQVREIKPVYEPYRVLVKYKNVIYHCQSIIKTQCGSTINCDSMSVHCVNDIIVEYLQ